VTGPTGVVEGEGASLTLIVTEEATGTTEVAGGGAMKLAVVVAWVSGTTGAAVETVGGQ
jgi:hypothetical protein